MLDDANNDAPAMDQPDPERLYRNCLVTCRRFGVEPAPPEHARDRVTKWAAALATRQAAPPVAH